MMTIYVISFLTFIFGLVTAKVFGGILSLGISVNIVKDAKSIALQMLGSCIAEMAYIRQLKIITMQECGHSDYAINTAQLKLKNEFDSWKNRSVKCITSNLTSRYDFLNDFNNFEQAMEKLDEFYKTKN
jgi:hypothetical protein